MNLNPRLPGKLREDTVAIAGDGHHGGAVLIFPEDRVEFRGGEFHFRLRDPRGFEAYAALGMPCGDHFTLFVTQESHLRISHFPKELIGCARKDFELLLAGEL